MTAKKPLATILYVAGEPDIRAIDELALQSVGGFSLTSCASGKEAIAVAQTFVPDLILLDAMMPEMDGPETLRKLREIPSVADVPAIFMAAKAQPDEVAEYRKLGVLGVIPKPFDPLSLAQRINDIWHSA